MGADKDTEPTLKQSGDQWSATISSPEMMEALGSKLGTHLVGGEVIALTGELGAGKTVLVRGLAMGLGIQAHSVTSPTFTLIHEYPGRVRLIHADLYRLENLTELSMIGFHEYFCSSHAIVIEWAERMGPELPEDRLAIHLQHQQRSIRKATLAAKGPDSQALLARARLRACT